MLALLLSVGCTLCVGCSGAVEHPPAGGQTSSADGAGSESTDYDPVEAAAARVRANACIPGSVRECRYYFVLDGQQQCPLRTQFCRADGTAWLACGLPGDGK